MKIKSIKNKDKILVIPDLHFPEQDDKSLEILYHVLKTDKFDELIQLGDMLDMYSLSSFSKDPEKMGAGLRLELELANKFLTKLRTLQPKAKITLLKGNHEDRFEKYIIDKAPGLAHLVDFRKMLNLDKLKIKYVDGIYRKGLLAFMHGTLVRAHSAHSAKSHFDKYTMSIIHGHTHRLGAYYKRNLMTTYSVHEAGCLCTMSPDYMKSKGVADWQQGFMVVYVDKSSGKFLPLTFPIYNHSTIYKDKVIQA